jgi:hypothetical protein
MAGPFRRCRTRNGSGVPPAARTSESTAPRNGHHATLPRCHAVSWTESLGPQARIAIVRTCKIRRLTCGSVEPPIGIEPMTYALRGARSLSAHALAAPIARVTARMALAALGLSGNPVHELVHARGLSHPATVRDLVEDAASADATGPCRVMNRLFYRPLPYPP